nr:uncharacterized protein LOC117281794 [Nicotiana tomentosiformis]
MHSGRRLSYVLSSRDAEDLAHTSSTPVHLDVLTERCGATQAQTSASPVTEDAFCDTEMPETDDLIQEPAETMVTAGPTAASTESASLPDDHAAAHPPIKRIRDEDDPNSVAGRDGMRLRLANDLKHTGCGTH